MSINPNFFFHWCFGEERFGSPIKARSSQFHYRYEPSVEKRDFSFSVEVTKAVEILDSRRRGKVIALCHGGGTDSELIALELKRAGIPFELYFLDNWGLNADLLQSWVLPLSQKLGVDVHIVRCSRPDLLIRQASRAFEIIGCEFPTYLAMTYLFERIPVDRFIVTGDGDLERSGQLYAFLGKTLPPPSVPGVHMPFSASSVAYHLWARENERDGEFYFFSSTPELIASVLLNRNFEMNYPFFNPKEILHEAYPEIARRPKSTNWDSANAAWENNLVRRTVREYVRSQGYDSFWRSAIATSVRMDEIFL